MRHQDKLNEGMREGDLADVVLPLLSVDEFQSKVDPDECIVFGFYVNDKEAADDLNRFLQKSSIPLLDTEVSPAPDTRGYYMVFVELMNNTRTAEHITALLAEIKTLVDIEEWQMRVRKNDGLLPFSEDNLIHALEKANKDEKKENVLEFFKNSVLSNVYFEDDLIILEGRDDRHVFRFEGLERISDIQQRLSESPISMSIRSIARTNRIQRILGEGWDVSLLGRYILVNNHTDPRGLLLTGV